MSKFARVGKIEDVNEGEMAAFDVSGHKVAVARVGGSLYAFGDVCTHARCSLADGELERKTVTCPATAASSTLRRVRCSILPRPSPSQSSGCGWRMTRSRWRRDR
jgi:nitrite reductase/ring-hydroxylating ferredoxin subunit